MKDLIERLAYRYFKARKGFTSSSEGDFYSAERDIKEVLDGEKEIFTLRWALSEEDYHFLETKVKGVHGKVFLLYQDVLSFCDRLNEELNLGNIRTVQELLDKRISFYQAESRKEERRAGVFSS